MYYSVETKNNLIFSTTNLVLAKQKSNLGSSDRDISSDLRIIVYT